MTLEFLSQVFQINIILAALWEQLIVNVCACMWMRGKHVNHSPVQEYNSEVVSRLSCLSFGLWLFSAQKKRLKEIRSRKEERRNGCTLMGYWEQEQQAKTGARGRRNRAWGGNYCMNPVRTVKSWDERSPFLSQPLVRPAGNLATPNEPAESCYVWVCKSAMWVVVDGDDSTT